MRDLLLGVDIGTSSSKGVLVQPDGTIVATAIRPHQLSMLKPGGSDQRGDRGARPGRPRTGEIRELPSQEASPLICGHARQGPGRQSPVPLPCQHRERPAADARLRRPGEVGSVAGSLLHESHFEGPCDLRPAMTSAAPRQEGDRERSTGRTVLNRTVHLRVRGAYARRVSCGSSAVGYRLGGA